MRLLANTVLVLIILLAAPSLFAQVDGGGVDNVEGISDGCAGTMNPDECMASGSGWTSTICSNEACPACRFDQTRA